MTAPQPDSRLYFDHITRDFALVTDPPRCKRVLARHASARGNTFHLSNPGATP